MAALPAAGRHRVGDAEGELVEVVCEVAAAVALVVHLEARQRQALSSVGHPARRAVRLAEDDAVILAETDHRDSKMTVLISEEWQPMAANDSAEWQCRPAPRPPPSGCRSPATPAATSRPCRRAPTWGPTALSSQESRHRLSSPIWYEADGRRCNVTMPPSPWSDPHAPTATR